MHLILCGVFIPYKRLTVYLVLNYIQFIRLTCDIVKSTKLLSVKKTFNLKHSLAVVCSLHFGPQHIVEKLPIFDGIASPKCARRLKHDAIPLRYLVYYYLSNYW